MRIDLKASFKWRLKMQNRKDIDGVYGPGMRGSSSGMRLTQIAYKFRSAHIRAD